MNSQRKVYQHTHNGSIRNERENGAENVFEETVDDKLKNINLHVLKAH